MAEQDPRFLQRERQALGADHEMRERHLPAHRQRGFLGDLALGAAAPLDQRGDALGPASQDHRAGAHFGAAQDDDDLLAIEAHSFGRALEDFSSGFGRFFAKELAQLRCSAPEPERRAEKGGGLAGSRFRGRIAHQRSREWRECGEAVADQPFGQFRRWRHDLRDPPPFEDFERPDHRPPQRPQAARSEEVIFPPTSHHGTFHQKRFLRRLSPRGENREGHEKWREETDSNLVPPLDDYP